MSLQEQQYLCRKFHLYRSCNFTNDGVGSQGHFDALTTITNNGGRLTNKAETIAMSALTTVSGISNRWYGKCNIPV